MEQELCISTYDFLTYIPNKWILLLLHKTMHIVQCWPINSFTVNSGLESTWIICVTFQSSWNRCSHSICLMGLLQTTPVPWKCSYLSYSRGFLYHCFFRPPTNIEITTNVIMKNFNHNVGTLTRKHNPWYFTKCHLTL